MVYYKKQIARLHGKGALQALQRTRPSGHLLLDHIHRLIDLSGSGMGCLSAKMLHLPVAGQHHSHGGTRSCAQAHGHEKCFRFHAHSLPSSPFCPAGAELSRKEPHIAMGILLKNAWIVDPVSATAATGDLLMENGIVSALAAGIAAKGHEIIDCTGLYLAPGLVDMHVLSLIHI